MRKFLVVVALFGFTLSSVMPARCEENVQSGLSQSSSGEHKPGSPLDFRAPSPPNSLKPEHRKKFEEMWAAYMTETTALRQQIASKRIELETLWAQPEVDRAKIEKLSSELAELYTERMKKCDDYIIKLRNEFGRMEWSCPIGRWQDDPPMPF